MSPKTVNPQTLTPWTETDPSRNPSPLKGLGFKGALKSTPLRKRPLKESFQEPQSPWFLLGPGQHELPERQKRFLLSDLGTEALFRCSLDRESRRTQRAQYPLIKEYT